MDWPIDWGGGGVITKTIYKILTVHWVVLIIGVEVALSPNLFITL